PCSLFTLSLHDALPIFHVSSSLLEVIEPRLHARPRTRSLEQLAVIARVWNSLASIRRSASACAETPAGGDEARAAARDTCLRATDRKSTRLNSSHVKIS